MSNKRHGKVNTPIEIPSDVSESVTAFSCNTGDVLTNTKRISKNGVYILSNYDNGNPAAEIFVYGNGKNKNEAEEYADAILMAFADSDDSYVNDKLPKDIAASMTYYSPDGMVKKQSSFVSGPNGSVIVLSESDPDGSDANVRKRIIETSDGFVIRNYEVDMGVDDYFPENVTACTTSVLDRSTDRFEMIRVGVYDHARKGWFSVPDSRSFLDVMASLEDIPDPEIEADKWDHYDSFTAAKIAHTPAVTHDADKIPLPNMLHQYRIDSQGKIDSYKFEQDATGKTVSVSEGKNMSDFDAFIARHIANAGKMTSNKSTGRYESLKELEHATNPHPENTELSFE